MSPETDAPGPDHALQTGRHRLVVAGGLAVLLLVMVGARLVELGVNAAGLEPTVATAPTPTTVGSRADIVDRHGELLATNIATHSLFADPRKVIDPAETAFRLTRVLPDLDEAELVRRMSSDRGFVWLARHLTPQQRAQIFALGLPGLDFRREERRFYPHGPLTAHVVGFTNIDGTGLAGIERQFDQELRQGGAPLRLSVDLRVQHQVRAELARAMAQYQAMGAMAIVLDTDTAEVVAMVSLPDYDPNFPADAHEDARFNRATQGIYEMGSTFKVLTTAMALEAGTVGITGGYDASRPLRVGGYNIQDYHAKNRWLSVPEILLHSSNIGAAKMALAVGIQGHKDFLDRLGLLRTTSLELPERTPPEIPDPWREISTVTISYGHGLAVAPVQLVNAIATVVNGGIHRPETLLRRTDPESVGLPVVSAKVSEQLRVLLRAVVTDGTGRRADAPGYLVGGKTGTAEKPGRGGYREKALLSSFVGVFPMNDPRYVVLVTLDEPQGTEETHGYATGGWVAAPSVGAIIRRTAPLLGVAATNENAPEVLKDLAIDIRTGRRGHATY